MLLKLLQRGLACNLILGLVVLAYSVTSQLTSHAGLEQYLSSLVSVWHSVYFSNNILSLSNPHFYITLLCTNHVGDIRKSNWFC